MLFFGPIDKRPVSRAGLNIDAARSIITIGHRASNQDPEAFRSIQVNEFQTDFLMIAQITVKHLFLNYTYS